jgi:hypothetical protein
MPHWLEGITARRLRTGLQSFGKQRLSNGTSFERRFAARSFGYLLRKKVHVIGSVAKRDRDISLERVYTTDSLRVKEL